MLGHTNLEIAGWVLESDLKRCLHRRFIEGSVAYHFQSPGLNGEGYVMDSDLVVVQSHLAETDVAVSVPPKWLRRKEVL